MHTKTDIINCNDDWQDTKYKDNKYKFNMIVIDKNILDLDPNKDIYTFENYQFSLLIKCKFVNNNNNILICCSHYLHTYRSTKLNKILDKQQYTNVINDMIFMDNDILLNTINDIISSKFNNIKFLIMGGDYNSRLINEYMKDYFNNYNSDKLLISYYDSNYSLNFSYDEHEYTISQRSTISVKVDDKDEFLSERNNTFNSVLLDNKKIDINSLNIFEESKLLKFLKIKISNYIV